MLELDGSYGEGGGQLLRMAVALAALTARPLRIVNIRARRDRPGLAPQHLAAVRAIATLCDGRVEGLALHSTALVFRPRGLRGGDYRVDVGTAGSVTLVLQAVLPVLLAAEGRSRVVVTGGTDVRQAPPIDYFRFVLLPLLERLGAQISVDVARRGYYPRGGGEVRVTVEPSALAPGRFEQQGRLQSVTGSVHVANLPAHIGDRMGRAALGRLARDGLGTARLETCVLGPDRAQGPGGAIVVWAATDSTVLGAARVAERGVRAEALGEAVAAELALDWRAGAALDTHAADQLLVYLALAGGGSLAVRTLSSHTRTAVWLIEQFLPVGVVLRADQPLARLKITPR